MLLLLVSSYLIHNIHYISCILHALHLGPCSINCINLEKKDILKESCMLS